MIVKLGDICSFQSGGTPSRRNPEYFSGNIPWITTTALNGKKIGRNDAVALITEQAVAESAAKIVPAGSIMVGTRVGVGKVAINTEVMSTSQDIISLLNIDENVWDKEFLCKFLQSKSSFLNSQARGATIKGIKIDVLSELDLPVMSKEEQTHISEIVDNVKKLISIRQQQLEKLDELVKARFVEMFGEPFSNPMKWKKVKIAKTVTVEPQNGMYKPQSNYVTDGFGTPILRIDGFYNGKVTSYSTLKRLICTDDEKQKYLLKEDDVVINRVNSLEYLGKCAHISGMAEETVYESNMMRMHFDSNRFNAVYVTHLLCSSFVYDQIVNHAKKAVNQASINQKDVLDFDIYEPPVELQNQYATFVKEVDKSKAVEGLYSSLCL